LERKIARKRGKDLSEQTILDHIVNVAQMCKSNGGKIGLECFAECIGLLHDMGKYQESFQRYIKSKFCNMEEVYKKVDHGIVGAKYIYDKYHNQSPLYEIASEIMSNIIAYHHGGLNDFLTYELDMPLKERLEKEEASKGLREVSDEFFSEIISEHALDILFKGAARELQEKIKLFKSKNMDVMIGLTLLSKYLYSCLVDADRTDSARFEDGYIASVEYAEWPRLLDILEEYIGSLKKGDSTINHLRNMISNRCKDFASNKSGIYTLSVPTGGGKTLSSLRFALAHAAKEKKDRIFYIIPYISIIEQNAIEIRRALNNSTCVLEHHSNVEIDDGFEENEKLAENWDVQLVITTMVQFLNTFYDKSTINTRRLHNLANSIIIIDEVQSVPTYCINLFNSALNFLAYACSSTILLCTATQPTLDRIKKPLLKSSQGEIVQNVEELFRKFKRVDIKYIQNVFDSSELADFAMDKLEENNSILIVLNTKKSVDKVYRALLGYASDELHIIYLTTYMCPAHRSETIKEFRKLLDEKKKVICVSTQLIEAGIDISADCVIRSLAGIDSIAQSSGRCNRHGEYDLKYCYLVNLADRDEDVSRLPDIRDAQRASLSVINRFKNNSGLFDNSLLSPKSVNTYYDLFYKDKQSEMDFKVKRYDTTIFELLSLNKSFRNAFTSRFGRVYEFSLAQAIRTAGEEFFVIDKNQRTVLVPYRRGRELILELNSENLDFGAMKKLLREAQQYSVTLFPHEVAAMGEGVYLLSNGLTYALSPDYYDKNTGVRIEGGEMGLCEV
jgi:CRISPR-associated endonuclease/helicase Cas3